MKPGITPFLHQLCLCFSGSDSFLRSPLPQKGYPLMCELKAGSSYVDASLGDVGISMVQFPHLCMDLTSSECWQEGSSNLLLQG